LQFKNKGNAHLQKGEFDAAIEAYTKAIELIPTDHIFYSNRSAAYLSSNQALKALDDAQVCINLAPTWPKGHSRKGAALHALKRFNDAKAAYEAGLVHAPEDPGLLGGLAELQKAQNPPPSSSRGFAFPPQLIAKLAGHPKYGPKMSDPAFLSKLQMIQTNPQLMLQDPEMMEVLSLMIGGEDGGDSPFGAPQRESPPPATAKPAPAPEAPKPAAPAPPATPAQAAKEKGNAFYKSKQFPEALAAYDEAISLDPTNMLLLNNKAAVYIELNEIDTALEWCQKAIELGRAQRASYEDLAKVYQRQAAAELKRDNIDLAIEHYRKAQMEFFDKNIERKIKNLELDLRKKQVQAYIDPAKGAEAKERGNTAFRDGNFGVAISEYEEAVKRDPTNAAYYNNLAAALLKVGDFNGAKSNVTKSLDLDKNYVKAWAKKGDIEFFMKEYHKAMDSYRKGLQLDPENALCKQGLQKTAAKINSGSSAEEQKERAAHAMADPEIQTILSDPIIRQVLSDMQENPATAQRAMSDPVVAAKLEKLIASGILQVR
jgi:stress-induced-phosphoprotein 1